MEYSVAKHAVKTRNDFNVPLRASNTFTQRSKMKDKLYSSSIEGHIENRRDYVLLVGIRTGKHKGLRAYKNLLDGSDPICLLCNQEPQDLQHWLQRCQVTEKLRFNLFGKDSGGLD